MNEKIEAKLKLLPDKPGVYKMYNSNGELIYVGKAVNLKNRVRQYFHASSNHTAKVMAMVANIDDFDFIIVGNETEALNLESNLIKQNMPHYNILLKDDKHFPYVKINLKQDFPQVEIVRKRKNDGCRYFGPFLSSLSLRESIDAVREAFPIRQCKKDLKKSIARGERPCLLYHIGKCCAPCSGNISKEEYRLLIDEVINVLQGNSKKYVDELTEQMNKASDELDFEKAAVYRDRIRALHRIAERQIASTVSEKCYDVFAVATNEVAAVVYGLFVRNGNVVGAENFFVNAIGEPHSEIIVQFLMQFYADREDVPSEIILSDDSSFFGAVEACLTQKCGYSVRIHIPLKGEKRKQAELAKMNAEASITRKRDIIHREWERNESPLLELIDIVEMNSFPHRIECFDNSHIRGRDTVGSMVVFVDGKPEKNEYRRFKTRQSTDGDDYLAMKEHLTRRFQRAYDGDEKFVSLPDLLVVDGGIGQVNVALDVLNSFGLSHIACIGLAEKNEEIILPNKSGSVILPKNSPVLHLLQRIRDEAHRFAITYHRSLRSKSSLYSVLDEIPGIGAKRKRSLFESFLSVDAIKKAEVDELSKIDSMNITAAKSVWNFFHQNEKENENGKL